MIGSLGTTQLCTRQVERSALSDLGGTVSRAVEFTFSRKVPKNPIRLGWRHSALACLSISSLPVECGDEIVV